jgi:hypothetical protein
MLPLSRPMRRNIGRQPWNRSGTPNVGLGLTVAVCQRIGSTETMTDRQPLSIVIRIPAVKISRDELSASLNVDIFRYDVSRPHADNYAQINIADAEDQWQAARQCIQLIRDPVRELISAELIGIPALDVALSFPDHLMARSWVIPANLAAAAGGAGIDIEVSVYLSCDADVKDVH